VSKTLRFEAEHLRVEHLRRLDERIVQLVERVRHEEIVKGAAALALSVAWDDEERAVMIDFALKGTETTKGRYRVPGSDEPELPFDDPEAEHETIVAGDGRKAALNPPPPLALEAGEVIDVEVVPEAPKRRGRRKAAQNGQVDEVALTGAEAALPVGDR